jgi:hypothetical protein
VLLAPHACTTHAQDIHQSKFVGAKEHFARTVLAACLPDVLQAGFVNRRVLICACFVGRFCKPALVL